MRLVGPSAPATKRASPARCANSSAAARAAAARPRDRRAPALAAGAWRAGRRSPQGFLACGARRARHGAQPERVTDRVGECRAIEGVEVKIAHAVAPQRLDLLDRNAGGEQTAGVLIVIEAGKALVQPAGNARAAAFGKAPH